MVLAGVLWAGVWTGQGAENPYQDIVVRNAFALKPIPPPDLTPPAPTLAPVDVMLTGLTDFGGSKKAFLQVVDKTAGKKPEFPILEEGGAQGPVEVVSIDIPKGTVVVRINGSEKTLDINKDAPKTGAPAGAAPPPGVIPNPAGMHPAGTALVPPPTVPGAAATVPGRYGPVMMGGGTGAAATTIGASPGAATSSGLPSRPLRTDSTILMGGSTGTTTPGSTPVAPGTSLMTREQQILHIEEQRKLIQEAEAAGAIKRGIMPPLPPTPLSSGASPGPPSPGGR
jgi:hypothetical protein